ncbi:uncharacterized protein LOC120336933 isoform X1 [Styela clava]
MHEKVGLLMAFLSVIYFRNAVISNKTRQIIKKHRITAIKRTKTRAWYLLCCLVVILCICKMDRTCIIAGRDDGLASSQCEFNKKCRRISIKNMPLGINNQDISDLLKPYHYQQIHIDKMNLSCKAVLLDGESACRCMEDLHLKSFRGSQLIVSLASCDFMLCVTQLPALYTREQFLTLITPFGTPERCFLVHSEVNGLSKGYGCVEFTSKESSIKAKNHLNGKSIGQQTLQVHWLDTIPQTYSGLHSSCLLVENLPNSLKESNKLRELFSHENIRPKFCQTSNCSERDFLIVEYLTPAHAEVLWMKMNNHKIGSSILCVSFCVPGPCGLVVLNSLKASRDLKRNNPSGGLLPTPVQKLDVSSHQHKAAINTKVPTTLQSALNGNLVHAAANHNDPEVQRLLKALHVRLLNAPNPVCLQQTTMIRNCAVTNDATMQPGMVSRQIVQPPQPFHGEPQPQFNQGFEGTACQIPPSGHLMPLQGRGRSASYDSGVQAATDDEVFSSGSSSQEDVGQFSDNVEQHPNNSANNIPYFFNGKWIKPDNRFRPDHPSAFCHRSGKVDMNQPIIPYHQPPGIITCQREELQRSDSSDSAYGGSQESTSSVSDVSTSNINGEMQHYLFSTAMQSGTAFQHLPSNHRQDGILGEHPSQKMQASKEYSKHVANTLPLSSLATKAKLVQEHSMICRNQSNNPNKQEGLQSNFSQYTRPLPRRAGIGELGKCDKMVMNGIPRPEFLFSSLSPKDEVLNPRHKVLSTMNGSNPAFTQHRSRLSTTPVSDMSSPCFNRKTSFSSLIADLHDIGADSPTQLQLLGSSLMEGLLGDSPRSTADSLTESGNGSSGAGRLLRALNLFSPTECLNSPHTPNMVRKRGCGMLPSPEPSPEAGAYVGQHSQGLGGHYANPFLSNLILHKRRRSNET